MSLLDEALNANNSFAMEYFRQGQSDIQQKRREEYIGSLMGSRGEPEILAPIARAALPGSGYLGGQMSNDELAFKMLMAPTQSSRSVGQNMMQNLGQTNFSYDDYASGTAEERDQYDRYMGRANKAVAPASIQEYNFFQTLNPDQRKVFEGIKRADKIMNLGTEQKNERTGESYKIQNREKASETEIGKEEGALIAAFPEEVSREIDRKRTMQTQLEGLKKMRSFAGYDTVGFAENIAGFGGTPADDMQGMIETFNAQEFLRNVPTMRGYGQLSDAEGKRLASALKSLNQKMSPAFFKETIDEIVVLLNKMDIAGDESAQRDLARYRKLTGSAPLPQKADSKSDPLGLF